MTLGDREGKRKRDLDGDGERERGREIHHPRTPASDGERERKRELAGIRGIPAGSLSVSGQKDTERGFRPDPRIFSKSPHIRHF
jgi:hypothetical protein